VLICEATPADQIREYVTLEMFVSTSPVGPRTPVPLVKDMVKVPVGEVV
jgi:hypothetical protein